MLKGLWTVRQVEGTVQKWQEPPYFCPTKLWILTRTPIINWWWIHSSFVRGLGTQSTLPLDIQWHRKWGSDLEYLILGVSLDGYHIINTWPVYVRSVNLKSHRQLSWLIRSSDGCWITLKGRLASPYSSLSLISYEFKFDKEWLEVESAPLHN